MRDVRDAVVKLFLNFLFEFIFVSIFTAMFSTSIVDQHMGLVGAFYVGLFEIRITFVLWLKALKLSKTTALVGNLVFLSPFISLIFIHFILHESIVPSTFVGLTLIVAGIILQKYSIALKSNSSYPER